ncbi:MAG: hypothetical protein GY696_35230 [Gammaproteobacteria bacterium]|nr:hypothetical protein [Gammaproteobacteria bacterium]
MEIIKFTEFVFHSGAPLDCVASWVVVSQGACVGSWVVVSQGACVGSWVVVRVGWQRAMFSEQQQKIPERDKRNRVRKTDSRLGGGVVKRLPLIPHEIDKVKTSGCSC